MPTFLDRNPKEKAVEEAFQELARNGYESNRPDPADDIFAVIERLKGWTKRAEPNADSARQQESTAPPVTFV